VADRRVGGDKALIDEMRRVQARDERLHDEAKREYMSMARLPDHGEWTAMSEITVIAVPCQLP